MTKAAKKTKAPKAPKAVETPAEGHFRVEIEGGGNSAWMGKIEAMGEARAIYADEDSKVTVHVADHEGNRVLTLEGKTTKTKAKAEVKAEAKAEVEESKKAPKAKMPKSVKEIVTRSRKENCMTTKYVELAKREQGVTRKEMLEISGAKQVTPAATLLLAAKRLGLSLSKRKNDNGQTAYVLA